MGIAEELEVIDEAMMYEQPATTKQIVTQAARVIRAQTEAQIEFAKTQWMLEQMVNSNSVNWSDVHNRVLANRKAMASLATLLLAQESADA